MKESIVPKDFEVPEVFETNGLKLRTLKITDVVKDYDAVMTSVDHLRGVFGLRTSWPPKDLTLEQDMIDLGWHQKEFQRRSSFAYTVMNLDESQCLGCMYIFPSTKGDYEVEVYAWLRKSEFDKGIDGDFFSALKGWISEKWPFKKVAYPGREIGWDTWEALP
jgi:hypothetical protein